MTRGKKHNAQRQPQYLPGSVPHTQSIPTVREGSYPPYIQGSQIQPYVQGFPARPYVQGTPVQPYLQGNSNQPGFAAGSRFPPSFGAPWDGRQQLPFPPPTGQLSQLQHPRNLSEHMTGQGSGSVYSTVPFGAKIGHGLQSNWNEEVQSLHWHQGGQPTSSSGVSSNNERLSAEVGGFQAIRSNPNFRTAGSRAKPREDTAVKGTISELDKLATEVYDDLLKEGKGVSVKKVLHGMLSAMGSVSLDSMGIQIQDISCLRQLSSLEAKVNASIQAYMVGRKISSLHDLICDVCQDEGVEEFEELGLGPPLFHPLIAKYFSPPETTNYCKITAVDVVLHLVKYLEEHKKCSPATKKAMKVELQEFLEYLARSLKVPTVQHLCLRIRSLGMFVGPIKKVMQKELNMKHFFISKRGDVSEQQGGITLTERVSQFLASAQNEGEDSQNRLEVESLKSAKSTDSEERLHKNGRDYNLGMTSSVSGSVPEGHQKANAGQVWGFSNCPYPSQAEEYIRAKKYGSSEVDNPYIMSEMELALFIAAWKGPCHNSSISEVLGMMLEAAPNTKLQGKVEKLSKKKAKRQATLLTSYPAVGLLNVAVLSMKAGHWDSMYDHFQEVTAADLWNEKEAKTSKIPVAIEVDYTPKSSRRGFKKSNDVDSEELLSAAVEHFDQFFLANDKKTDGKRMWETVRWALDCEKHVANVFSDKIFVELGFENIVEFLEHHLELLPRRMVNSLMLNSSSSSDHETAVLQQRLLNFVTQAVRAFGSGVSLDKIVLQLSKHFGRHFVEKVGTEAIDVTLKNVLKGESSALCGTLLFSGALLSNDPDEGFLSRKGLDCRSKVTAQVNVGSVGSVSSLDVKACLLGVPMLCDLKDWSKWQVFFAPSFGPFLDWFEYEGSGSGLCVLMTCSGTFLRIEGMATAEDFLTVIARGTGKEIAEKLLSLVSVYGGVPNLPKSLLKSYAKKAFDVRLGIPINNDNLSPDGNSRSMKRKQTDAIQDDVDSSKKVKLSVHSPSENSNVKHPEYSISEGSVRADSTRTSVGPRGSIVSSERVANCVLDCLFSLPSEFRMLGGEILLPAVFSSMSLAPRIFLNACKTIEHRVMVHGIGLEMDIPEWVTDYESYVFNSLIGNRTEHQGDVIRQVDNGASIKTHNTEKVDTEDNLEIRVDTVDAMKSSRQGSKNSELEMSNIHDTTGITDVDNHDVVMMSKLETSGEMHNDATDKMEREAEKVIMSIRHDEFGIEQGVESSDDTLLARQHARMGRALSCLSRNLYCEDCHFVLELVQNADDNSYAAGVEATLVFNVQQGRVLVLNNEVGFTAANMRALCDIGNSTKSGSNAGYIGHKGIGFKSVFRVTDSPEIHSNGFHVKFDSSRGDIGFILPTPVPTPTDDHALKDYFSGILSNKTTKNLKVSWNTRIDLPLKPSLSNEMGMNSVTAMFNDLHPTLLLFLHKVRTIVVRNDVTKSLCYMERCDIGNNLVKLVNGGTSSTWLVVRKKLEASVYRAGISSTEIALAFPLEELHDGSFDASMGKQKVFAFLPLRSYGLRFIVQADFILPSSREEVDHDSSWNQWLLSEVPGLFLEAADSFRGLPAVKDLGNILSSYMKFVPMDNEVVGFFSCLPCMILSGLRSSPCLPIQDGEGACALPCTLLRGWDESVRSLLPDSLLHDHLGMHYLDSRVLLSDALALSLGVQVYGLETLLSMMKSICSKSGCLESLGLNWIHCWVVEWQKCSSLGQKGLEKFVYKDAELYMLRELQSLPFIGLSNGIFTSIIEGLLWFTNSIANEEANPEMQMFSLLYSDLRTVHPKMLQCSTECGDAHAKSLTATSSESVKHFLVKLGVCELSAHEIIKSHILPKILDPNCIRNDKLLVVQYVAFIMLHFYSDCKDCTVEKDIILRKLQKECIILTSEGLIRLDNGFIHFPVQLGNKINMRQISDGVEVFWPEVDPVYIQFLPPQSNNFCRSFFEGLGVTDFLHVVPVEKTVYDKSISIWKDCSWEFTDDSKEYVIEDWECPELSHILEALCRSPRTHDPCSKLLMALDMFWNEQYSQFSRSKYRLSGLSDLGQGFGVTESTFVLIMRQFSWIKSSRDRELHAPKELFHCSDAIEKLLGSHASYAMPQIQSMGLVEALGLRTSVSLNDIYDLFKAWNVSGSCEASVSHMTRIYSFLYAETGPEEEVILKLFKSWQCVFVPDVLNLDSEKCTKGKMYKLPEVSWSDSTGSLDVLDSHSHASKARCQVDLGFAFALKPMCKVYPSLATFFTGVLHIKEQPDFGGYLLILLNIAAIFSPDEAKLQISGIFSALSSEIELGRVSGEDLAKWKGKLLSTGARVFPTMHDTWVSLSAKDKLICWCDNEDLLKYSNSLKDRINFVFVDKMQIDKAEPHQDHVSKFQILMSSLGVPRFSDLVEREVIAYGSYNSERLEELVRWTFQYVQRYIKQFQPQLYETLKGIKVEDRLRKLEVLVVDKLFIRYNLSSITWSSERRNQQCLLQGDTFYVSFSNLGNYSTLYLELSRFFFGEKSDSHLANILHLITLMAESGSSESNIETFICSDQGIPPLPDGEPSWVGDLKPEVVTLDTTRTSASSYLERHRARREAQQKAFLSNLSGNVWSPHSHAPRPVEQNFEEGDPEYGSRKMMWRTLENSKAQTEKIPPLSYVRADIIPDEPSPSSLDKGDMPSNSISDCRKKKRNAVVPEQSSKPCANLETTNLNMTELSLVMAADVDDKGRGFSIAKFSERDHLNIISDMTSEQYKAIGHMGEFLVFQHLIARHGISHVRWLNECVESGAPFDIIINEGTAEEEFVEVKTTRSLDKDWFEISVPEWEFARRKGSRFTIFRVFLGGTDPSTTRLLPIPDPARLCHDHVIQLALLLSRHQILDVQHN